MDVQEMLGGGYCALTIITSLPDLEPMKNRHPTF